MGKGPGYREGLNCYIMFVGPAAYDVMYFSDVSFVALCIIIVQNTKESGLALTVELCTQWEKRVGYHAVEGDKLCFV